MIVKYSTKKDEVTVKLSRLEVRQFQSGEAGVRVVREAIDAVVKATRRPHAQAPEVDLSCAAAEPPDMSASDKAFVATCLSITEPNTDNHDNP